MERLWEKRVYIEIEVGKEIPSPDRVRRWEEAVRKTPGAVSPQPYNRVWITSLDITDPDGGSVGRGWSGNPSASLGEAIDELKSRLPALLARALGGDVVPIDGRLAAALGTTREPSRGELADRVATVGKRPGPPQEAIEMLVDIALHAQTYYDDPRESRRLERASVGFDVHPRALTQEQNAHVSGWLGASGDELIYAAEQIGLDLLEAMGFETW